MSDLIDTDTPTAGKHSHMINHTMSAAAPPAGAPHTHSINVAPTLNLVAGAPPASLDADWFEDQHLAGPTPLTVLASGQVYGHIATWGTCHIGFSGQCVKPPRSKTNYANFHLGAVETNRGQIAVGRITMNTGHADLTMSATDTVAHYDHTGSMVASVRAGEDEHGIWVAGAMHDGATEEQKRQLMASGGISGDWRSIGGNLELVAALAVNVPGFPVPRPALAASGAANIALVAANIVAPTEKVPTADEIADKVLDRMDRRARIASLQPVVDEAAEHAKAKRTERIKALQAVTQ